MIFFSLDMTSNYSWILSFLLKARSFGRNESVLGVNNVLSQKRVSINKNEGLCLMDLLLWRWRSEAVTSSTNREEVHQKRPRVCLNYFDAGFVFELNTSITYAEDFFYPLNKFSHWSTCVKDSDGNARAFCTTAQYSSLKSDLMTLNDGLRPDLSSPDCIFICDAQKKRNNHIIIMWNVFDSHENCAASKSVIVWWLKNLDYQILKT